MVQRHRATAAAAGAWVFPGGGLEPIDGALVVGDGDEAERQRRRRLSCDDATAFYVAATRELFEEAGILLAWPATSEMERAQWRRGLLAGDYDFATLLATASLRLSLDSLLYVAHWRTPEGRPRRFDTRFFLTAAPEGCQLLSDGAETVAHEWCRPSEALDRYDAGEWQLLLPTRTLLEQLRPFKEVGEALAFFEQQPRPTMVQPVDVAREGGLVAELPASPRRD